MISGSFAASPATRHTSLDALAPRTLLYAHTVFYLDLVCAMENDLIDDSGFELGMLSVEGMLRHECDLLHSELEVTRRDLRRAHQTIGGMIVMHQTLSKELAALKVEHNRISLRLSQFYEADRQKKPTLGYSYGDHLNRKP